MREKTFVAPVKESRYAVAFRAHEQRKAGCPRVEWIELTVVGPSREKAVDHAKKKIAAVGGLVYEGTS